MRIVNGICLFWREYLSNWKIAPFEIRGVTYNCVEQFMMAEKARVCGDEESLKKIMDAKLPADQKRLGRSVSPYNAEVWEKVRYDVVLQATLEKYRQNGDLLAKLSETPSEVVLFAEASPLDKVWGIGLAEDHEDAGYPERWPGTNLLGKAVTEVFETLVKHK
jgi:hypothetical protein